MVDTKRKPPHPPKLTSLESLRQAAECLETLAHPHRLCIPEVAANRRARLGFITLPPSITLVDNVSPDRDTCPFQSLS
jgi:hypothetical protein